MSLTRIRAANINGIVYNTVPLNASNSNTGGNGGAGTRLGSGNSFLDSVEVSSVDNGGVFASTVLDNNIADKALDSGIFAFNNNAPIAKKLTSKISSVNNDYLLSGAAVPSNVNSIHFLQTLRTTKTATAIREKKYDMYNNIWESGYPITIEDSLGFDVAAGPTRNIPGYLIMLTNGKNIESIPYKAKN